MQLGYHTLTTEIRGVIYRLHQGLNINGRKIVRLDLLPERGETEQMIVIQDIEKCLASKSRTLLKKLRKKTESMPHPYRPLKAHSEKKAKTMNEHSINLSGNNLGHSVFFS